MLFRQFQIATLAMTAWLSSSADPHAALMWPTPNPAFQNAQPIESFIQPTVSGLPESGLFGCVRNGGRRFHEGIDLYPIGRDQRGEASDPIYAVLPGRVVYLNKSSAHSNYGRYIVIEHDQESPAFHTLYAHLASIEAAITVGRRVDSGTALGIMGRSAASTIPRARAHLHFEIGFRLTDDFQTWYDRQPFDTTNRHGNWNGMNLVSIDPLDFYASIRQGSVRSLAEYLKYIPTYARIRVHSSTIPDFVNNYPALVTRPYAGQQVIAWDIAFSEYGVPKEWTPRFIDEAIGGRPGDVKIVAYNPKRLKEQSCQHVLNLHSNTPQISARTLKTLKKLFGFQ